MQTTSAADVRRRLKLRGYCFCTCNFSSHLEVLYPCSSISNIAKSHLTPYAIGLAKQIRLTWQEWTRISFNTWSRQANTLRMGHRPPRESNTCFICQFG